MHLQHHSVLLILPVAIGPLAVELAMMEQDGVREPWKLGITHVTEWKRQSESHVSPMLMANIYVYVVVLDQVINVFLLFLTLTH